MSVIKSERTLSEMEFYKTAVYIRNDISKWILTNFGKSKTFKSIDCLFKGQMSSEDVNIINSIFIKYGQESKSPFNVKYDDLFINYEKNRLLEIMSRMMDYIIQANSIFPSNEINVEEKKLLQTKAIGQCYTLLHELQYLNILLPYDLNSIINILCEIDKEIKLLVGWKKSIQKIKK